MSEPTQADRELADTFYDEGNFCDTQVCEGQRRKRFAQLIAESRAKEREDDQRVIANLRKQSGERWEMYMTEHSKVYAQREVIAKCKEYIQLLASELAEVVPLAFVHGWRSTRYEEGKKIREALAEIEKLKGE